MEKAYLTEIELPFWQDPQGNVILEKCRDACHIYCNCWEDNTPTYASYYGKISLKNAWAVKSLDVEFYDLHPKEEYQFKSSIFKVEHSVWLPKMIQERRSYYPEWKGYKNRTFHHYHIKGHDNYFDVIAEDYTAEKLPKTNTSHYKRLWTNEA